MCGLLGFIGADAGRPPAMRSLSHRGPDARDTYASGDLYIRHFRLAIIGAEKTAHQPMVSFDGNVRVAFNGEIYNYKELAAWMGQPQLQEHGDTRVLLELLARHRMERLDLLIGMFAFAAYFEDTRELFLVRDRFGVKPMYYLTRGGALYFASEIKALEAVRPLGLSEERAREYLEAGVYPSGRDTFFDGVMQVEAGTWLRYRDRRIATGRYYDLLQECRALQDGPLEVEGYEALLADAVKLRLRSDVPISLHFSAGTDSTALLLKTKEVWGWDFPITAFTMGYADPEVDESQLAADHCRRIGVEQRRVQLDAEEVPELAVALHDFQDEPYGGVPTIAYYKMNQVERELGYIVSIEGQGGDETLAGYRSHAFLAMLDLHASGEDPELLQLMLKAHGTDLTSAIRAAEALLAAGFRSHTDMTDLRARRGRPVEKHLDWLKTIQLHDILVNKIPRTLRFNDRASMACGREVRFPLLDHRVLAYGLAFTHRQKFAGGLGKAPLRDIVRRHFPGVHTAPKRSVVTPQTKWFKGPLRSWVQERLALLRRTGFLQPQAFAAADEFFASSAPENSFPVWQLVNLSFFFDSERQPGRA
jgi:asparagine synthase (glutamine-hydrolysing)